ncbi:hypothetical protein RHSIM_Rhsim08G0024000 [Rhododendron simsii]|uniref:Legume lectin domain-containing protein n=1 Tax=Rhododendron simsii TaxID=118357 RepID=A0A834GG71_RHOSS|nr:hypothetical protein RHSIM_Rhsim08G0024000 [Rhododendron simsii]
MGLTVKLRIITAMLLCFMAVAAQHLKTFTATYGPFNSSYYDIFRFENSATINNGAIQLTPYKPYQRGPMTRPLGDQYGRVRLNQPFKLWEQGYNKTSDRVASFNSSFLFSLCPLGGNS